MQTDFLSPRTALDMFVDAKQLTLPSEKGMAIKPEVFQADGVYVVLDLGREEAGFLDIDFDAQAGTIVDIGWGEHLDDLRVRTYVGERNFAVRYICKEGRQQFTHYFTRLAGRYLQLHITGATEKFILHFAGLKPVEYPA
jgi:hypothetical protein